MSSVNNYGKYIFKIIHIRMYLSGNVINFKVVTCLSYGHIVRA